MPKELKLPSLYGVGIMMAECLETTTNGPVTGTQCFAIRFWVGGQTNVWVVLLLGIISHGS